MSVAAKRIESIAPEDTAAAIGGDQRAHERLATLIASLQSGVLVEDERRTIIVCNEAFCRFFSVPVPPEQMIGIDCSGSAEQSMMLFQDPQAFVERIEAILAAREIVLGERIEMADSRILERDYVPVYSNNTYLGHMWNYRDITRQIQLQQEVENRANELARFGYIISHDLKAPLRGINFFASVLEEDHADKLDDEGKELLSNIKAQTVRMRGMIESLFKVALAGGLQIAREHTPVRVLVDEVLLSLAGALQADAVTVEIVDPLPTWSCDRTRMQEVLSNLISNAAKYNDKPDKKITIRGDRSSLFIEDNGIGIPADKLGYVFDPLRRIDPLGQNAEGTGVGLTIVRGIVQQHRGSIRVSSKVGEWTKFEVHLPFES